jgi:hypothetical protein
MTKTVFLLLLVVFPLVSFAAVGPTPTMPLDDFRGTKYSVPISNLNDVSGTIENIVNWAIYMFWIVAVAFLFWAAYLFLTAGGDEEKVKEAKQRIKYALIAAAVAILSTGIDYIVWNLIIGRTS